MLADSLLFLLTLRSALAGHGTQDGPTVISTPVDYSTLPLGHPVCENTCTGTSGNVLWVGDGICDDGGPGHFFSDCDWGTDCDDCKPRDGSPPPRT